MPVSLKGEGYVIRLISRNPLTLNDTGLLIIGNQYLLFHEALPFL